MSMATPTWDISPISMSSTGIPSPHCHATINHRGDFTDDFNHNREEKREERGAKKGGRSLQCSSSGS